MDLIRTITPHVSGISEHLGGSGDPSPATALGVLWAMKAVAERLWGDAVAGGPPRRASTGWARWAARSPTTSTPRAPGSRWPTSGRTAAAAVAARTGAAVVAPDEAHAVACDIYSPCALGGALSASTIPELRCGGGGRMCQQPARHAAGCPADRRFRCAVRARLRGERRRSDQHRRGEGWLRSGPCRGAHPGDPRHRPPRARPRRRRRGSPPRRPPTCSRSAGSTRHGCERSASARSRRADNLWP